MARLWNANLRRTWKTLPNRRLPGMGTAHPFTIEIGVLFLLGHVAGPSRAGDLDGDNFSVSAIQSHRPDDAADF